MLDIGIDRTIIGVAFTVKGLGMQKRPIPKKSDAFLLQRHTLEASDYSKIRPFLHNLDDPTFS